MSRLVWELSTTRTENVSCDAVVLFAASRGRSSNGRLTQLDEKGECQDDGQNETDERRLAGDESRQARKDGMTASETPAGRKTSSKWRRSSSNSQ